MEIREIDSTEIEAVSGAGWKEKYCEFLASIAGIPMLCDIPRGRLAPGTVGGGSPMPAKLPEYVR